jgi:hypothetical protein
MPDPKPTVVYDDGPQLAYESGLEVVDPPPAFEDHEQRQHFYESGLEVVDSSHALVDSKTSSGDHDRDHHHEPKSLAFHHQPPLDSPKGLAPPYSAYHSKKQPPLGHDVQTPDQASFALSPLSPYQHHHALPQPSPLSIDTRHFHHTNYNDGPEFHPASPSARSTSPAMDAASLSAIELYHNTLHSPTTSHHRAPKPQYPDTRPWYHDSICGLRRRTALIAFAALVVLVLVITGIGLGVGLTRRNQQGGVAGETSSARIACPGDDGKVYRASGTERYFRVTCNADYNDGGAVDTLETDTLAKCIAECAAREGNTEDGCVAASWGRRSGVQTCFMRGAMPAQQDDSPDSAVVREVDKP